MKIREGLYLTIFCWFVVVRNNRGKIKPTFILDIPGEAVSVSSLADLQRKDIIKYTGLLRSS